MYEIYVSNQLIGFTKLETGDPPMGVASGSVELLAKEEDRESFLLSVGAVFQEFFFEIGENPDLVVKDKHQNLINALFCYFIYAPEFNEAYIEVCGIDPKEYEERFPETFLQYYNPDDEL